MLNSDMDAELQEAIRELGSNFEVDRCRHATCAETTIWVFARIAELKRGALVTRGAQVATIVRRPPGELWAGAWRVHMMSGGVPTAQHFTNGLARACAYVFQSTLQKGATG